MIDSYWKDRRVLITGYEGFLGSNLTKSLLDMGAKVWGIDILTRRKNTLLSVKDFARMKIIKGSVENPALLRRIMRENKIETVFHLAAKSLVGYCYKRPSAAFSTNIQGTWNVLEACRNNKTVKAIIIASSDKAYGSHTKLPYKEEAALSGAHPYDVSKSCADLIAHTYFNTYGLPVGVTRCGNIFGPGDFNFSRIVPDAIRSALSGRTLIIRSDGKFVRDYIYVDDVVEGYLSLARNLHRLKLSSQAFNFSCETPFSVLALIKRIYRVCGKSPKYKILNQAKYEIRNQFLSSRKARRILGWKPRYRLEESLRKTVSWYRDYLYAKRKKRSTEESKKFPVT